MQKELDTLLTQPAIKDEEPHEMQDSHFQEYWAALD